MPKIVILNIRADYTAEVAQRLPAVTSCLRLLWLAREGDVVVTPSPIGAEFVHHVEDTLGMRRDAVRVLSWNGVLGDDDLGSERFLDSLRPLLGTAEDWELMPCRFTEGTAVLAGLLGLPGHAGTVFAAQRGPELLNRKSNFRQLSSGIGLPVPEGAPVRTPGALARYVERLLPATGRMIVKADNAGGGSGNIVLTTGPAGPVPGARETWHVDGSHRDVAERLWAELTDDGSRVVVAESYHAASAMFYFEYVIGEDATPRFVDSGTIRVEPGPDPDAPALEWIGLEIPADVPPFTLAEALTWATVFAGHAARIGYRGYLNIDAILTESGRVLFNECNARWGGGLAPHMVAERLLGPRYADGHAVHSLRDIPSIPLAAFQELLRAHGLLFDRARGEGVVALACDPSGRERTECVVIGRDHGRNREIERALRTAVTGRSPDTGDRAGRARAVTVR